MTVKLACGHVAQVPDNPHVKPGDWLSCWALMYPSGDCCQTQVKVLEVTR